MRRLLAALFVLCALPAQALDVVDRVRIPEQRRGKDGKPVYLASLASYTGRLPVFQIVTPGGGGGGGSITPTTPVTGITDCAVLYVNSTVVGGDATNFCWTDTTNASLLTLGSGTGPGALKLLEGSGGGTSGVTLTAAAALSGDFTVTLPSATTTLAGLGVVQTFTANQTLSGAELTMALNGGVNFVSGEARIVADSDMTPDAPVLSTGATANSWHVYERADGAFDFTNGPCGTAACTNPQVIVHDKDQNVTNYQSVGLSGLSGRFVVTLTESTPTSVVIIPVPAATSVSGEMLYTVHARDATNSQTRSGRIIWNGVAEGTTATCVIGTAEELDNTPTGTLTAAITCTSPANNQIQLLIDAASSLTQTTLEAYVTLILVGAGEAIPQ